MGSGSDPQEIRDLLKQYNQSKKMMANLGGNRRAQQKMMRQFGKSDEIIIQNINIDFFRLMNHADFRNQKRAWKNIGGWWLKKYDGRRVWFSKN